MKALTRVVLVIMMLVLSMGSESFGVSWVRFEHIGATSSAPLDPPVNRPQDTYVMRGTVKSYAQYEDTTIDVYQSVHDGVENYFSQQVRLMQYESDTYIADISVLPYGYTWHSESNIPGGGGPDGGYVHFQIDYPW